MQYRHEIGHALTNFAFAADTKRKTSVPLFFASTGGLRLPLLQHYMQKNLLSPYIYLLLSCLNFPQILKVFCLIRNLLLLQTLIGIAPDAVQNNCP